MNEIVHNFVITRRYYFMKMHLVAALSVVMLGSLISGQSVQASEKSAANTVVTVNEEQSNDIDEKTQLDDTSVNEQITQDDFIDDEESEIAADQEDSEMDTATNVTAVQKVGNATKIVAKRIKIVAFAKTLVGNPYRYGGTSLTKGTDCSGFVMGVYKKFGYKLPRTSREQSTVGKKVAFSKMQAGDLIFYRHGGKTINHVAMYIGSGKVVHASSKKTGIKISKYNYSKPYKAVSIIK